MSTENNSKRDIIHWKGQNMKQTTETTCSFTAFDTNDYSYDCKLKIPYSQIYKNEDTYSDYSKLSNCKCGAGIYFFVDQNHNVYICCRIS